MNDPLAPFADEANAIAREAGDAFGHLSAQQLNWRPGPDEWSVAECLDHLIRINSAYFPILEAIHRGEHKRSWKERLPLLPRLGAAMVLKAVRPDARRKFKTNPEFRPSQSAFDGSVVSRFLAHQRQIVDHMRKTADLEVDERIITSPAAAAITYSLRDAYEIMVVHERRHLVQARRVMEAPGFPKA